MSEEAGAFEPTPVAQRDGDGPGLFTPWNCAVLTWLFMGLSVVARIVRYAMCPPLWGDEHFQAAAFLDLGYLDLLQPLPYEQVAPVGFLWVELTFVKLLGFHEWSLRLFPLLAGIGSVFLIYHVARRLLADLPCLLAVAVFCSTYSLVRYSTEVKPYGSDALVALGLIALMVEYWRDSTRVRWLWGLALATPLALCLSFPAVFVAGGISVGLLRAVWQARSRAAWAGYVAFNALLAGTFLGLHFGIMSRHYENSTSYMLPFWNDGFMPIAEPWRIPRWLIEMHTGEMFAYPFGGNNFQSALTTIGCGAGLWCCWERRTRSLFWGVVGLFGLALVAAALRRYPHGIHPRVVLYAAGPVCLLFGAGAAFLAGKIRAERMRLRSLGAVFGLLAILLGAYIVHDLFRPYRSVPDKVHRGFAQWLWLSEPQADIVCVRARWHGDLYCGNHDSAFRCNARIFQQGRPANGLDANPLTPGKVLRCVVFHSVSATIDQPKFDAWMRSMSERFTLIGTESYSIPISGDVYDVYRFLPSTDSAGSAARARPGTQSLSGGQADPPIQRAKLGNGP